MAERARMASAITVCSAEGSDSQNDFEPFTASDGEDKGESFAPVSSCNSSASSLRATSAHWALGCRSAEPEARTTQASQTAALPEIRYFVIADT